MQYLKICDSEHFKNRLSLLGGKTILFPFRQNILALSFRNFTLQKVNLSIILSIFGCNMYPMTVKVT